jgi:hypothetical protein
MREAALCILWPSPYLITRPNKPESPSFSLAYRISIPDRHKGGASRDTQYIRGSGQASPRMAFPALPDGLQWGLDTGKALRPSLSPLFYSHNLP